MAAEQRALVVEIASTELDRLETALRHAIAVAGRGRAVWVVLSGEAIIAATKDGLRRLRRASGRLYSSVAMRQASLGMADAETHFEALRALPCRLIILEEDMRDYAIPVEDLRQSPAVEVMTRTALIKEAQSDAWMVF